MIHSLLHVEHVSPTDQLIDAPETKLGHYFPHFRCDISEKIHNVLGLAGKPLAKFRVHRRHTYGTGVKVTLPHHNAAFRDQCSSRKTEFIGAEQRTDNDVTASAKPTIDLDCDTAP